MAFRQLIAKFSSCFPSFFFFKFRYNWHNIILISAIQLLKSPIHSLFPVFHFSLSLSTGAFLLSIRLIRIFWPSDRRKSEEEERKWRQGRRRKVDRQQKEGWGERKKDVYLTLALFQVALASLFLFTVYHFEILISIHNLFPCPNSHLIPKPTEFCAFTIQSFSELLGGHWLPTTKSNNLPSGESGLLCHRGPAPP